MANIDIEIRDNEWIDGRSEPNGDVLHTTIYVNGTPMHLEAHAVKWIGKEDNRMQVDDGKLSEYEGLHAAFDIDDPQVALTIGGRSYVLFAHAHGGGKPPEKNIEPREVIGWAIKTDKGKWFRDYKTLDVGWRQRYVYDDRIDAVRTLKALRRLGLSRCTFTLVRIDRKPA